VAVLRGVRPRFPLERKRYLRRDAPVARLHPGSVVNSEGRFVHTERESRPVSGSSSASGSAERRYFSTSDSSPSFASSRVSKATFASVMVRPVDWDTSYSSVIRPERDSPLDSSNGEMVNERTTGIILPAILSKVMTATICKRLSGYCCAVKTMIHVRISPSDGIFPNDYHRRQEYR
jgi:hypothetical protein